LVLGFFLLVLVGLVSHSGDRRTASYSAMPALATKESGAIVREAEPVGLPDHNKTPGAWDPGLTVEDLRKPGFAKSERHVSQTLRRRVFDRYGIPPADRANWILDHLCPRELGGLSSLENFWPEPIAGEWSAHKKDVLENRLRALVLSGQLSLTAVQQAISTDWIAAYKTYVSKEAEAQK
jgi:hypothetical protein